MHCPVDNKQYKRMDIEHVDDSITSLDIISVNPLAQPFVRTGNTILDPHCPTSRGMGKWWPNENIYTTSLQIYSIIIYNVLCINLFIGGTTIYIYKTDYEKKLRNCFPNGYFQYFGNYVFTVHIDLY